MSRHFALSAAWAFVVALSVGCATSGRHVVLEEYAANLPKGRTDLTGVKVHVGTFTCTRDEARGKSKDAASVEDVDLRKFTREEQGRWDARHRELNRGFKPRPDRLIGNLRNGFGMVLSHVYTLTPPEQWYRDALCLELQNAGAVLVDNPADADVAVDGQIVWLNIDMYMTYWCDLIVDARYTPRGQPSTVHPLHTTGKSTAWSTSSFEYYQPIRHAQQRSYALLLADLAALHAR